MAEKIDVEWNEKKSYVCLDYPAVVANEDKMMKTLGGKEELSRVVETPNSRLPLRFRPGDVYCKPVHGDRANVNRILLKVKRNKKCTNLQVEMMGIVDITYKFEKMADFQYLPMTRSANGDYQGSYEEIAPTKMHDSSWMNQPAPMFLPPIAFSGMDTPCDFDFRTGMLVPPNESLEEKNIDGTIGNSRKKRCHFATYVKFKCAEMPDKPTPECERNIFDLEDETSKELIKEVQTLFEKRPVWNKCALTIILKCSNDALKAVLPYVSYYFETGPWRTLWVRFGYDPRKDPEAKMYQTIDLRLKRSGGIIPSYSRWRGGAYRKKAKIASPISKEISTIDKKDSKRKQSPGNSPLTEVKEKKRYSYYKGIIPPKSQSLFQLCDIHFDEVQVLVRENDGRELRCNSKEGWFENGFMAKCRAMLVQDIKNSLSCSPRETKSAHLKVNEKK